MAWTQVNKTQWNSSAAATTHTPTAFPSATANNLIIVCVNADAVINSFTAGYTQAASGVNFTDLRIYYKIAAGGETSLSIGLANTRSAQMVAFEYSGNVTSGPLDLANGTTGSNTSPTTPSITTTNANDLIIVCFGGDDTHTYSALTGTYTQETDQRTTGSGGSGAEASMLTASRIVTATGSQSAGITQSGVNTAWEACIATFKLAASAQDTPELYGRPFGRRGQTQMAQLIVQ